ncbi:MAG: NAD(P)/FAD-dependent oxidoreductase [Thermoplasmata archaeon]|nr:MAG: NAD(P)/FAD-dependent oxidoreductase [Thermoplasmata archaeon]
MGDGIDYDVIVVGAGPAGLVAGEYAARTGAKVVVIDRKREIGAPVRCGEGLGTPSFDLLGLQPSSDFVLNKVNKAVLFSPKGRTLKISFPYREFSLYSLDRCAFEKTLASRMEAQGGETLLDTQATGLLRKEGKILGLKTTKGGILGKVIIGADGLESRIGRWCKLVKRLKMNEIYTCAQYTLIDLEGIDDHFEIHFGAKYAPGGYAWLFPKGNREVNLGLGVLASYNQKPIELLNKFKKKRAEKAHFTRFVTGCIPSTLPPPKTVKENILLVGDAARQTNAVSGGGIANAILAGKIAGKVAGEVSVGNKPISSLEEYETSWRSHLEKILIKKYKQRRFLESDKKNERMFSFMKLAATLKPIIPKSVIVRWLTPDF